MNRSVLRVFVNVLFIFVLLVASIPSLSLNIFDREIDYKGINLSDICLNRYENEETGEEETSFCLPKFNFTNTRAFEDQSVFRFEFTGINSNEIMTDEFKLQSFERDFAIFKRRVELLELPDYSIKKVITDDNKYFVEVFVPSDYEGTYLSAFSTLTAAGDFPIYEDVENYQKVEEEGQEFDFLEGKKISEFLSLKDAQRISKPYFDGRIGNGQGGFVIKVDFGQENLENVMRSAQATYTAEEVLFPGIIIVHGGLPIGLQAAYIPPAQQGYEGQSHIVFTVLGEMLNQFRVKTLYSMISTEPINSEMSIVETYSTGGLYDRSQVEYIKLSIPLGLLLVALFAFFKFGKIGLIWSVNLFVVLLFGVGFSQLGLFKVPLGDGLIWGTIWGLLFGGLLTFDVLNWKGETLDDHFDKLRQRFWVIMPAILVGIIAVAIVIKSNMVLNVVYSILIYLIATLYLIEGWIHAIYPYLFNKKK
jgi:hypothetical protein